jgi:hypothetical protein
MLILLHYVLITIQLLKIHMHDLDFVQEYILLESIHQEMFHHSNILLMQVYTNIEN